MNTGYKGNLSYLDVKKRLLSINDERKQALLTLIFLTGSRVGEIVRHHLDKKNTPEEKMINCPVKDTDIYMTEVEKRDEKGKLILGDNGKPITVKRMVVRIKVQKTKQKRFRLVYINHIKEKDLAILVWRYKKKIEKEGGGFLFDFGTRRVQEYFSYYFPEFDYGVHHLRHWRITAYLAGEVTDKRVPKDIVAKIVGHSKLTTTNIYDHTDVKNFAGEL